jgi:hypothetical protein
VVAVRISECLRKRSIVAEYDEEAVSSARRYGAALSRQLMITDESDISFALYYCRLLLLA